MVAPLLYGLYLLAGRYAVKKIGEKVAGKLISRHGTRELAKKARLSLEKKLETKNVPQHKIEYSTTGQKGRTPAVSKGRDLGIMPLSRFQKGVQNDLLRAQAAGVGKGKLENIIKATIPGVILTAATGYGVNKITSNQNKKLKAALKREINIANAPTKREYMKAANPQNPSETARADKSFEDFMAGKTSSLKFKHGGMVKKTRKKRKK